MVYIKKPKKPRIIKCEHKDYKGRLIRKMCVSCYKMWSYHNLKGYREMQIKSVTKWNKNNRERVNKAKREWYKTHTKDQYKWIAFSLLRRGLREKFIEKSQIKKILREF